MASSMRLSVLLVFIILSFLFSFCSSSPSLSSMCRPQMNPFLCDQQLQCPATIESSLPIEMDGESVDNVLERNAYTAILFYASWCPFSRVMQPKFDALALMYPQMKHVKLEQSSALPSLFSRHGIHSVPSILIANKTTRLRYRGPKHIHSLVEFYRITTGFEPAMNITEDDNYSPQSLHFWKEEPYLVFSLLFVLSKALIVVFPYIIPSVITLWVTYVPRLNLAIFGESRQVLTHLFDVKSAFSKLKKLRKIRNFHNGARSARVLASSLASVSLGETSSARD